MPDMVGLLNGRFSRRDDPPLDVSLEDGQMLVTCSDDRSVRVYDCSRWELLDAGTRVRTTGVYAGVVCAVFEGLERNWGETKPLKTTLGFGFCARVLGTQPEVLNSNLSQTRAGPWGHCPKSLDSQILKPAQRHFCVLFGPDAKPGPNHGTATQNSCRTTSRPHHLVAGPSPGPTKRQTPSAPGGARRCLATACR